MTDGCSERGDQLAPYVDGELDAADAEAFALHLAACAACRDGLHDALQLVALEARATGMPAAREPRPRIARDRVRRWNRRQTLAITIAAAAVLAVVAFVALGRRGGGTVPPDAPLALATADVRSLEGRVAYAAADRHRRYAVVRAGAPAAPADVIPLPTLAELERRGDPHGVAAAYLLLGDPGRARTYLERAAANPDVAADRALVLLSTGHPDEALIALDGVLDAAPRHPQARWNRALALRDLGLPRMAIAAFEAAAELGEPGWAEEARARAKALADETDARQARSEQLVAAGRQLAAAPGAISADLARQIPGLARVYFYDAVRGATTAEAVRALAPLARTLDAIAGDHALIDHAERIAHAEFSRRGPLAARYAKLVAGQPLDPAAARAFLDALRAARQDDILLGALVRTRPDQVVPEAELPELRRLAGAAAAPWFRLLAAQKQAAVLIARGDAEAAELTVLPALAECRTSYLDFWCAQLDLALGESYLISLRLSDARRVLGDALARARRSGEWELEQWFYPDLVNLEVLGDDVSQSRLPLVRAYLGELMRRDPSCATEVWSRQEIAMVLANRPGFDAARAELARADEVKARCPEARSIVTSVFVKAQVARDDEVAAVRAEIAALRAEPTTTPGGQAILDQTEGRMLVPRDRAAGTALLERAIAKARTLAAGDVEGHKARSYAYALLTLDAGRAAEWPRVWQLLQDEAGVAIERCGLGVSVEPSRSVVVVRDAAGSFAGVYDAARHGELDALHLVPGALRDALRGCPEVEVLARPPIQGSPALLPPELAWSFRSAAAARAAAVPPAHGARLVISNTEPPPELGLPHLLPWRSADPPDVALEGAAATPSRALAALAGAGFVEIHAHGTVNAAVSDASFLMMSPDPGGRYALTAAEIRKQPLHGRPIVILAACHAGATAPYRHEPWGLPAAFIEAGARAVIASPDVIDDADAGQWFDAVRARIERGSPPAIALHDARLEWLASHPDAAWVRSLMVFR